MHTSEATRRWIAGSAAEALQHGAAQIDLDDLLRAEPADAVRVGLACLQQIVAALPSADLDAMLTIPLDSGPWDQKPPSLDELLALRWPYGPGRSVPGLYVVHERLWRRPEQVEEHKWPLASPSIPVEAVAYFKAWRDLGEPEFARCIYVRSVPS